MQKYFCFPRQKMAAAVLVILFAVLGFLAIGSLKSNAAAIPMCASGYLTCANPHDGDYNGEKCISEWECGGAGTETSTCMMTMPATNPILDSSATSFSDKTICIDSVIGATRLCAVSSCHLLGFAKTFEQFDGQTCTVRKIKTGDNTTLLQDSGYYNHAALQCIRCAPASGWLDPDDGITKFNMQLAICGDSAGIYLDNNTGECNGGGATKVFSQYCGAESFCDGKVYKDTCSNISPGDSCGVCDASGQCANTLCVPKDPTVKITPIFQSGDPGSTLAYNVTITNNNRGNCANETFNLTSAVPAGWTGSFSAASVTLAPCASQTVTLDVASSLCSATDTTYNFSVTATGNINGKSATGASKFKVLANSLCTLTATPNQIPAGNSSQLDWTTVAGITSAVINPGAIAAVPVAAGNVNVTPAAVVGIYTYSMDLTAPCGIINNACSATVEVCAANWGDPCASTNGCFAGTFACDGVTCADGAGNPVADDSYYGNACQSAANNCNQTNPGQEDCDHQCINPFPGGPVVSKPADEPGCTLTNDCGDSVDGYYCDAANPTICTDSLSNPLSAPPNPLNYGDACSSPPNTCDETIAGTVGCAGLCSVLVPPPNPPGVGLSCTATNSCGASATGITQCDLSCDAVLPPVVTGGLVPCGRYCDDPATPWDDRSPCNICFMLQTLKNIVDYITLKVGIPIALFILIISGLFYAISAGNEGRMSLAKSAIGKTIAGLVIIFIAWLLVNGILAAFGYVNTANWSMINCSL